MMLGLTGSGKTAFSKNLVESKGLDRFSIDEQYFARAGNTQQKQRDEAIEKEVSDGYQYTTPEMLDDFYKRFDPPNPDEATFIN